MSQDQINSLSEKVKYLKLLLIQVNMTKFKIILPRISFRINSKHSIMREK